MRRLGLAVLFAAGLALSGAFSAVAVVAETTSSTTAATSTAPPPETTTAPTTTAATTTTAPAPTLPEGVTVGGVAVGGLTPTEAYQALQSSLDEPLRLVLGSTRLAPTRAQLGATAYLRGAISRAKSAAPGTSVDVVVAVDGRAVRAYVARLAARFDRTPQPATLRLRNLQPYVTKERPGLGLRTGEATTAIVAALRAGSTRPLVLPATVSRPTVTRASIGPVIVIRRGDNRLLLYRGMQPWRTFTVATGQPAYPTPLGRFQIVVKWKDPWWYPPPDPWAAGEKPTPPGPGNPLGTRWMGISSPGVGIHGTPDPASLGYSASHGCIRMAIPEAEWLFDHVAVGTPVFVVSA